MGNQPAPRSPHPTRSWEGGGDAWIALPHLCVHFRPGSSAQAARPPLPPSGPTTTRSGPRPPVSTRAGAAPRHLPPGLPGPRPTKPAVTSRPPGGPLPRHLRPRPALPSPCRAYRLLRVDVDLEGLLLKGLQSDLHGACAGAWTPRGGRDPRALRRKAVGVGACHIRPAESRSSRAPRPLAAPPVPPPSPQARPAVLPLTRQPPGPQEAPGTPRRPQRIRYLTTGWWPPSP